MNEAVDDNAMSHQPVSPALSAADPWTHAVVEPLARTITEQQHQLVIQAEIIGAIRAELTSAWARIAVLEQPKLEPDPSPFPPTLPPSPNNRPWYPRWRSWLVAGLVVVMVGSVSCQAAVPKFNLYQARLALP